MLGAGQKKENGGGRDRINRRTVGEKKEDNTVKGGGGGEREWKRRKGKGDLGNGFLKGFFVLHIWGKRGGGR